jgi:hypothetical protein
MTTFYVVLNTPVTGEEDSPRKAMEHFIKARVFPTCDGCYEVRYSLKNHTDRSYTHPMKYSQIGLTSDEVYDYFYRVHAPQILKRQGWGIFKEVSL